MKSIRKQVRKADLTNKKESHGKLGGNLEDVHMQDSMSDARIYERNSETGQIRSRKPGDHGNERIEEVGKVMRGQARDLQVDAYNENAKIEETIEGNINEVMDKVIHPLRGRIRAEALSELWAANKLNHEGHWYIRLTDVVNIMGDYDDLYENESKS